ncbi:MAG: hypothetical protein IJ814_05515 [Paludibacteraceae bacterium]|nr:hypothetical protein [Paludibacteraceae bacterium]
MQKFTSILCALMVLLSVNAAPQLKPLANDAKLAKIEKTDAAKQEKLSSEKQIRKFVKGEQAPAINRAKSPKAKVADAIAIVITDAKLNDYTDDSEPVWQIEGETADGIFVGLLCNSASIAGHFTTTDFDDYYSYVGMDEEYYDLTNADLTVTYTDGIAHVTGSFVGLGEENEVEQAFTFDITTAAPIKWNLLGKATVTATYLAMFTSATEQVDTLNVYENEDAKGVYKIDNALVASGAPIIIYAQDPELVYILPTDLAFYNSSYGYVMIRSRGGYYIDYYGVSAEIVAANFGTGTDYWGKKVKNIITFSEDAISAGFSAYNGGTWWGGKRFIVELPDLVAPTITAVNDFSIGGTKAIVEVVADDDADVVDSLTFTVKNGETVILENAKTTDGKLTITGLTVSTTYNLTLIATDRTGKSSEAFAFTLTTGATDDDQAPVLTKAELKEVSDKWATIEVAATDNVTAAADIVYVVTFADATTVTLTAEEGLIKLTGLTPETAYAVTVTAKDEADNSSAASETINFTTLEIIPIVMNIDWIQAQYYANYSSAGAYDFEIGYWEGDNNYVIFDTYTKKSNAISGTWSTADGTIAANYSSIKYNGASIKVVSATQTLVFVSLDETTNQATYNASFEVMGDDGNLYKGAYTTEVRTFYKSGNNSYYQSMEGELPDTKAPTLSNASATIGADFTSATITVRATDNETATASIKVELQLEDGTKVADFTYSSYQFSASVTDLTPNTEYTYYIAAEDEAGNKTAAADRLKVTFKTADEKAPTISTVTASDITENSATITVHATDNISKDKLTVYISSKEDGSDNLGNLALESSMKYTGTITGLEAGTKYDLFAIVKDEAGNVANKTVSFTTLTANNAPVIGEIVATPTVDGATVTIVATDDNTAAADLTVIIQDADQLEVADATLNATTGLFEATITGLTANTEYTFTVWVFDEAYKYASQSFTFTTLADTPQAIDNTNAAMKATKRIENGTLVIIKNGAKYNALGEAVR